MKLLGTGTLPMRTGRGLNDRLSPIVRSTKVKHERQSAALIAKVALSPRDFPPSKLLLLQLEHRFVVQLCRCTPSARPADDDNLTGSLKGFRDGIADRLRVDDGDRRVVRFEYSQKTRRPWAVEFSIGIELRPLTELEHQVLAIATFGGIVLEGT